MIRSNPIKIELYSLENFYMVVLKPFQAGDLNVLGLFIVGKHILIAPAWVSHVLKHKQEVYPQREGPCLHLV